MKEPSADVTVVVGLALVVLALSGARANGSARGRATRAALDGVWNSATATPLERPRELKEKAFFTPAEAAAWERQAAAANAEPSDNEPRRGTGTYNTFYREFGTRVVKTRRTSIVIDPPDGRIPALMPAAGAIMDAQRARQRNPENPEDMGLQDQCLAFETAGPPMLPYSYNSNVQIVQAPDAVVFHVEMNHERASFAWTADPTRHPPSDSGWAIRSDGGTATRSWSTRRTSTMPADSTATPAGTSAGTVSCASRNGFVCSTPQLCCISSTSTIPLRSHVRGAAS